MGAVVTYQDVITSEHHVRIKKASVYSTRVVWNISYSLTGASNHEQPFLIQTPWMVIPYPVIFKDESKTFQFTCCHDECCSLMQEIETHILKRVNTAHVDIHNKKVLSAVRTLSNEDKILKLTGNTYDTSFFDQNGNQLDGPQCLSQHKRVCAILFVKAAWCSSTYFGLDVVPLQIKVEVIPKLETPCFLPEECFQELVVDDKYRKMLRLKIPADAIKNRMKLDGHADAVIDVLINKLSEENKPSNTVQSILPPSPPSETIHLGFLSQIKSGDFKLKQRIAGGVNEIDKKVSVDRKLSKLITNKSRQVAPSLDDILHAKERLRAPQKEMNE
jgi:hypothetical protein